MPRKKPHLPDDKSRVTYAELSETRAALDRLRQKMSEDLGLGREMAESEFLRMIHIDYANARLPKSEQIKADPLSEFVPVSRIREGVPQREAELQRLLAEKKAALERTIAAQRAEMERVEAELRALNGEGERKVA